MISDVERVPDLSLLSTELTFTAHFFYTISDFLSTLLHGEHFCNNSLRAWSLWTVTVDIPFYIFDLILYLISKTIKTLNLIRYLS